MRALIAFFLLSNTATFPTLPVPSDDWQVWQDHAPIQDQEWLPLCRVLWRLGQRSPEVLDQISRAAPAPTTWHEHPTEMRGQWCAFSGQVISSKTIPLVAEAQGSFPFTEIHRLVVRPVDQGPPAIVYCRSVSRAWKRMEASEIPFNEPCRVVGVFLKTLTEPDRDSQPLVAAGHVSWYPRQGNFAAKVPPSWVELAQLGIDMSLWDQVRQQKPLVAEDRECFYQLLSAAGAAEFLTSTGPTARLDIPAVLQDPIRHQGTPYEVRGTARRVVRVEVESAELRQRFGVDHYFEVDMFVPLDPPVRLLQQPQGSSSAEPGTGQLFSTFPVTCCVRKWPAHLPIGDKVTQEVRVVGCFFKVWTYASEFMSRADESSGAGGNARSGPSARRQPSPLLIAHRADPVAPQTPAYPPLGWGIGGAFVMVCGVLLWWHRREGAAKRSARHASGHRPPADLELD